VNVADSLNVGLANERSTGVKGQPCLLRRDRMRAVVEMKLKNTCPGSRHGGGRLLAGKRESDTRIPFPAISTTPADLNRRARFVVVEDAIAVAIGSE